MEDNAERVEQEQQDTYVAEVRSTMDSEQDKGEKAEGEWEKKKGEYKAEILNSRPGTTDSKTNLRTSRTLRSQNTPTLKLRSTLSTTQ